MEHVNLVAGAVRVGYQQAWPNDVEGGIDVHWVGVLERENMKPVLVPQVATHPLNTKVVCHLCKVDDDHYSSFYFLNRSNRGGLLYKHQKRVSFCLKNNTLVLYCCIFYQRETLMLLGKSLALIIVSNTKSSLYTSNFLIS